jgi:chromosome segregation protein
MRLKKLKLSGFKSFVEPTTVDFPSSLVAVVGPNGCGKSNIIDAVRWVMGESSAKHLRGESMADVIFNGSRDRKPLGQASIELIFENDAGRLLGEYASYSEISIKRLVTRDGQSNYYLNGTKCRKKDVTDIFLGTGLGPRSYSIIGQGTISRLIEAKPEEMRVFLEEAAGISKYKERRRETENRIKHTEENLSRVLDLREELGKQLDRLKRQAAAAEKFKEFKARERLYKAQWHALRWLDLTKQIEVFDRTLSEKGVALEALLTEQNRLDITIEDQREGFQSANDRLNQVQGEYYRIGSEIARLEESMQHQKARKLQLEQDLSQAKQDWQTASQHVEANRQKSQTLSEDIEVLTPVLEELKESYSISRGKLEETEQQKENWQSQWDNFIQVSAESSKVAHVEQSKIQQIESSVKALQLRIEKLEEEKRHLDIEPAKADIAALNSEIEIISLQHEEMTLALETLQDSLKQQRNELEQLQESFQTDKTTLDQLKAKEASLIQIQQAALGKDDSAETQWLDAHQLSDAKRLAQVISVEADYETALEVVLGDKLQALCVDDVKTLASEVTSIEKGCFTFVDNKQSLTAAVVCDKPALYQKVQTNYAICQNLLSGIYIADNLEQAIEWLPEIAKHESIITKDGILIGQGWCRVSKEKDAKSGIIAREKAIKELHQQIVELEAKQSESKALIEQHKQTQENFEIQKQENQANLNELFSTLSDKRSMLKVKQNRMEQIQMRLTVIEEEYKQEIENRHGYEQQLLEARETWQEAMATMEMDAERRESLTTEQQSLNEALETYRRESSELRQALHDKELSFNSKQSELQSIQSSLNHEQAQLEVLNERIEALTLNAEQAKSESEQSPELQLEEKLKLHVIAEEKLNAEKKQLDELRLSLTQVEKKRNEVAESIRNEQSRIDSVRMDRQTVIVRRQTIEETLEENDEQLKPVIESLPETANEKEWDEELKSIAIKIQRLGAINLAAIDEYEIESERKRYLDEQHDDLTTALDTLREAIDKIDKETRTRFRDTYDQVNEGFQKLFPKLFGGGQAYLDLTGEDLLDTGVTVMARPPGKRNSTIHLLSGGEKALTAVALVFAIFQLNPSPFCMLDEVDAPLDDANVTRFCSLVKEMAEHVQFIFISHNKVAMEMAQQLMGVTMHEPGVSRIVSVDVEEAIAIAT